MRLKHTFFIDGCQFLQSMINKIWYALRALKFYLFGVLHRFQHCTGHITMDSFVGKGNQYIQLVKVLYCKLPTNGKQLPVFLLEVKPGTKPQSQRWEVRVLPLCHHGLQDPFKNLVLGMIA